MIPKRIIINDIWQSYYSKIDHRLRYIGVKDFSNELNCKKPLNLIQYLEDDIINYSSTVMFRGTPCMFWFPISVCLLQNSTSSASSLLWKCLFNFLPKSREVFRIFWTHVTLCVLTVYLWIRFLIKTSSISAFLQYMFLFSLCFIMFLDIRCFFPYLFLEFAELHSFCNSSSLNLDIHMHQFLCEIILLYVPGFQVPSCVP